MMGKKRWMFFRKLRKESSSSSSSSPSTPTPPPSPRRWRWSLFGSAFKWRRLSLQLSFFDDVLFKVVSAFEAVVLVIALAFFYLFCGCHF